MRYHNKNQIAIILRLQGEAAELEEAARKKTQEAVELIEEVRTEHGKKIVIENQAFIIEDGMHEPARLTKAGQFKSIE